MSTQMAESQFKLNHPPIVEAVLDFDCDMPPGFNLDALEEIARSTFRAQYPKFQPQFFEQHRFETKQNEPSKHFATRILQAFHFFHTDLKQLVQIRTQGFSFNRLPPYTILDDYLPEIRRTWELFIQIASPVQIRAIRLRCVNRILLPITEGQVELAEYFQVSPKLPDKDKLQFASFLNQHSAIERGTGFHVDIVLASQPPEQAHLPVVLDIAVANSKSTKPDDWDSIFGQIQPLRALQVRLFRNTLTDKCLNLFS
jgi:uncharacterized protein (TIGR04255 family)